MSKGTLFGSPIVCRSRQFIEGTDFVDERELFSIGEFANLARTSEKTLRHYDKIGLLEPIFRKGNNYRCYSIRQLAGVNAIRTFQKLGVSLAEIKELRDKRTPAIANAILDRQIEELDAKAANINDAKQLLLTLQKFIKEGLVANKDAISIQFVPAEPVIFGDKNDYSNGRNDYDALRTFYKAMMERYAGWDLSYPIWGVFTLEQIIQKQWKWPDRYYFTNPNGQDQKPAAMYAIGYAHAGYSRGNELFKRMLSYIEQHNFEICGDAYAEYPLNEICIVDDKNYLMRLMITVREKH